MTIRSLCCALSVLFLLAASPLTAGIVYDNGAPNQLNGVEMTRYMQADDFAVAAPITFNRIRLWTLQPTGTPSSYLGDIVWIINQNFSPGDFPHYLYETTFRGPVTRTFVQTVSVNVSGTAGPALYDEYRVDLSLVTPATMGPGTYWISAHNGGYSNITSLDYYWETTNNNGTYSSYNFDRQATPSPGPWIVNSLASPGEAQLAFQLLLDVPEPSSFLLLAGGLISGVGLRRRRSI